MIPSLVLLSRVVLAMAVTAAVGVRLDKSVMVKMRDGVHLSTDLYFPDNSENRSSPETKLPVILVRTPYDKHQLESNNILRFFVEHGYVVAIQDLRGKFESEGRFRTYSAIDRTDGYDTVTWLASQPWSNGKIGTYGCSYLGEVQDELAAMRHPNHAAAIVSGAADYMSGGMRAFGFIRYGALELAGAFAWNRHETNIYYGPPAWVDREKWFKSDAAKYFNVAPVLPQIDTMSVLNTLPVIDMMKKAGAPPNDFEDWLSHEPKDPWWQYQGGATDADRFNVPSIQVTSWYDTPFSTLTMFNLYRTNGETSQAKDNQFLIVSPTVHCKTEAAEDDTTVGEREFHHARLDYLHIYLQWFDHWLKGLENGATKMPKVNLYVMGKDEWQTFDEWPPAQMRYTNWYFHSDGHANSRFGTGALSSEPPSSEPPDSFIYDPETPVPTRGGQICCTGGAIPEGAVDQSEVETRSDILVYTSRVLETGVQITGPLNVILYVSSSARDTDFTAKLVDVYPDGRAFNVQEGITRARYREGYNQQLWMTNGQVYSVTVDLDATSNYFGPGHRIRVEISSSNFPRFDRNLNTGGSNYNEFKGVAARNKVEHSKPYASRIVLPILVQSQSESPRH